MSGFHPLRAAKRRRIIEHAPIEDALWDWALREHRIFHWLSPSDLALLRELSTVFLDEKRFEPLGAAKVDEELKVSVAAQASLLLLGLDADWYEGFSTIMITEREYDVEKREMDEAGVMHEYEDSFAGESFDLGPVALSRVDIEASGWGDGYNVVIHEMAHKLDGRDGSYDGAPPLHPGMSRAAWREAFSEAFDDLRRRLDSPRPRRARGRSRGAGAPRIDSYAAESPDEFFAVASEYFYERPALLKSEYPAVYGQLALFYRRDPCA
jgi:MtfA peptidase